MTPWRTLQRVAASFSSPSSLAPESFSTYPPRARRIAEDNLPLLRELPLAFLALLLRELLATEYGFPAEQREIDAQFSYLRALSPEDLRAQMEPFTRLHLAPELETADWIAAPARFSEQLTAHLWATHQIDAFRAAATDYVAKVRAASPPDEPPIPRLCIVVIGQGVAENRYPLFRRLRPHGVWFRRVNPANGWQILQDALAARAAVHPIPYGHWQIDGSDSPPNPKGVAAVSWRALAPVRAALLDRVRKAKLAGTGSEALRTMLAEMDPRDLGFDSAHDPTLARFQTALFTEGSGTQFYSTTFVQWAAREALRRAQPVTLLARFAPRIRELSLGEILSNPRQSPPPDPQGALIDADMSAWYTWLGQHRLSAAAQSRFLVWFEDHPEALAIAPSLKPATISDEPIGLSTLLARL